jgi:hypothetical protein
MIIFRILLIIFIFTIFVFFWDLFRYRGDLLIGDRIIFNQVLNFFLALLGIHILARRIDSGKIIDYITIILGIFTIVNVITIILFLLDFNWAMNLLGLLYNKKMDTDFEGVNSLLEMNYVLNRPLGLFFGSNQLGFYGVFFFFFTIWRFKVQPHLSLSKLFFYLASAIFIIITSQSRTSIILFLFMNLIVNLKKTLLLLLLGFFAISLYSLDALEFRQLELLSFEKSSEKFFTERLVYWIQFIFDWTNQANPFLGFVNPKLSFKFYESGLLNMTAEMGLFFTVVFILFILYFINKLRSKNYSDELKILRLILIFTLIVEFFQGNFFAERMVIVNALLFCFFVRIIDDGFILRTQNL